MNPSSKKFIPLSAYDTPRLVTEHATRAQAAEKVLHARKNIPTSNPKPTHIPEQQTMSDECKLATRAEGYRIIIFILLN